MRLVERHIVKDNRFEDICFKSGLLYNYVLYNIRQGIFSGCLLYTSAMKQSGELLAWLVDLFKKDGNRFMIADRCV